LPWVVYPWGLGRQLTNPPTWRRYATHNIRPIQHRIDRRFVWCGCCVVLGMLLHCVVCSWVFARQPSDPEAARNAEHTPHTIPIRQAFRMVWVLCNVGCLVTLGYLPVGFGTDSPATQRRHATRISLDRRFVWCGCCVVLVVLLLHCVVCSWVFTRRPSSPEATHNTQHTSHHIQHRFDRRFVWFWCCVMLVVLLPWVCCLWGFARQRNNLEATCNTQRTPHTTPN
jgi:rubredoxin